MKINGQNMFKEERKAGILQILEAERRAEVPDLSQRFKVSADTIRRDLRELESDGLIRKTHGGALQRIASPPPYTVRLVQASKLKEAIGRRAAELVEEGDSIVIDSGTTTLCLARALSVNRLRVLTNSLEIGHVIAEQKQYELILLGGRYDRVHQELVGAATVEQLSRYRVDKVFMGMTAIDRANGITDDSEEDAAFKRNLTRVSQQVIGLADHTKIGRVSFSLVAPASEIDIFITDDQADCTAFSGMNWKLIQVSQDVAIADANTN